jgi:hypothetical protein
LRALLLKFKDADFYLLKVLKWLQLRVNPSTRAVLASWMNQADL